MEPNLYRLKGKLMLLNDLILNRQMQGQGLDVLLHGGGEEAHFNRAALRQLREKRAVHYDRIGIWIYERAMDNLRGQNEMQWDKKIEKFRGLIHE